MITIILLYFLTFLLIWQFVGYPTLMTIIALMSKKSKDVKDYTYTPFVSIIVPVYNEEKVIERRIYNLLNLNYPKNKYEIIIVESGSTDNTNPIVKDIIKKETSNPKIKLLHEIKRKGKSSAINLGKKYVKGEIMLITDATNIFDKNVLKKLIPHFKDPKIGAVGGRCVILNSDTNVYTASESFYSNLEDILFVGESILDSACVLHGGISAWRKDLREVDTEMLAEDLDMSIQTRYDGYTIKYEQNAIYYESSASSIKDQTKQRKRTIIGTIQCIFKHWDYFLLPRDLYSLIIFPSHKTLTMFSPFILLVIPILYIATGDIGIITTHFILTLLILMGMFTLLMLLKSRLPKDEKTKSPFSISLIPKIIYYVLLNEYLILLAWKDFILGRYSVLWEKAESTR